MKRSLVRYNYVGGEMILNQQEAACSSVPLDQPVRASMSLCCGIIRAGWQHPEVMHDGLCRERHGVKLGRTYYLTDCGLTAEEVTSLAPNAGVTGVKPVGEASGSAQG